MSARFIRRGALTRAIFDRYENEDIGGERHVQHFPGPGDPIYPWAVCPRDVREIRAFFADHRSLRMEQTARGYMIRVPNQYAYEFFLLPR